MFWGLKLRKIRLEEQNKLEETALYLYRDITAYIMNSDLQYNEKEEVLQQIVDMLLEAQASKRDINIVIGPDYELFCREVIGEYMHSKKLGYKILNFLQKYLIWLLLYVAIFCIANRINNKSTTLSITVNELLFANFWALVFIPFTKEAKRTSITNYTKQGNFLGYIFQGMYRSKQKFLYVFVLTGALIFGVKYMLINFWGNSLINRNLELLSNKKYIIVILLVIIGVETYKKAYDRETY